MRRKFISTFAIVALVVVPGAAWLMTTSTEDDITLFDITRNLDEDKLNYDLNFDEQGDLVMDNPIHPYWIRNTEGGVIKELNGMQRKFAYGLKYLKKSEDSYIFQFVSYKKRNFFLRGSGNGKYHVYTKLNNKFVIVENLHIQVTKNGTIFDLPKVEYIDITYRELNKDSESTKRVYINDDEIQ